MSTQSRFDVIIIGTGAGTLAHELAPTGKRILLLERRDAAATFGGRKITGIPALSTRPNHVQPKSLTQNYPPRLLSIVPASLTSNLPGASTLMAFTTPSSTNMEKRCERIPIPRAVRSFSSPSFFT